MILNQASHIVHLISSVSNFIQHFIYLHRYCCGYYRKVDNQKKSMLIIFFHTLRDNIDLFQISHCDIDLQ